MTYSIEDLNIPKNNSSKEQDRARVIFLDLRGKAAKGENLTEHEKRWLWEALKISRIPNDGVWSDYPCLYGEQFKYIYLSCINNLTQGGKIEKTAYGSLYEPSKPSKQEIEEDLNFLQSQANDWEAVISKKNHSNQLLQESATECRDQIKKNPLGADYDKAKFLTLLISKYIYHYILLSYEKADPKDFILSLNEETFEFTEFTFVHILTRHFAETSRIHNMDKTYHNMNFNPKILASQLKKIFKEINYSRLYRGEDMRKISFSYKGSNYVVFTERKIKQIKGTGNVTYMRIQTLYPIEAAIEGYIKTPINKNLFVYRQHLP